MTFQYKNIQKILSIIIIMFITMPTFTKAQAFVDAVVDSVIVMPLKLSSFTANRLEKSAQLKWVVESEKNGSHFAIQKSYDGKIFETIATVKIASTSSYTYTDNNIAEKTLYYRLEAVDIDGKSNFTNIIMLKTNGNSLQEVSIYPNPITNYTLNLNIKNLPLEKYNIELKAVNGVIVFRKLIDLTSINIAMTLDLPRHLSKGIYVLHLYNEKGVAENKKVIIN